MAPQANVPRQQQLRITESRVTRILKQRARAPEFKKINVKKFLPAFLQRRTNPGRFGIRPMEWHVVTLPENRGFRPLQQDPLTKVSYGYTKIRSKDGKIEEELFTAIVPDLPFSTWCPEGSFKLSEQVELITWKPSGSTLYRDSAAAKHSVKLPRGASIAGDSWGAFAAQVASGSSFDMTQLRMALEKFERTPSPLGPHGASGSSFDMTELQLEVEKIQRTPSPLASGDWEEAQGMGDDEEMT